jgi:FixJ family two-component response regulator
MPKSPKDKVAGLTPRVREVVRLTSLGCTIHEIAAILDVASPTADQCELRANAYKVSRSTFQTPASYPTKRRTLFPVVGDS